MPTKAMVVLSGGQDSTTTLFWAKVNYQDIRAISFNYGQRHFAELSAAMKVASMADVPHDIVDVTDAMLSRSPLTDPSAPLETYKNYQEMDKIIGNRVELTFVPMRNAFFLTLAANRALFHNCYNLVTGVCQMDNANYPDCRRDFIESQEKTINIALGLDKSYGKHSFRILAPLMDLSKEQTVKLAKNLPGCWEALAFSHTCYAGHVPPCGVCHACTLRAEGFKLAGFPDPLVERFKEVAQ